MADSLRNKGRTKFLRRAPGLLILMSAVSLAACDKMPAMDGIGAADAVATEGSVPGGGGILR